MKQWPWEMEEIDMAWASVAHRFGKTLEQLDEVEWPRIGQLFELLNWEDRLRSYGR